MTKTEEIEARRAKYNRIERAVDEMGRTIGVKMLKPSQRTRVEELAPGLDGYNVIVDDDRASKTYGRELKIPKIVNLMVAAAVCEIDGSPITFAKNRPELDAILDRLDTEGLTAANEAMSRFYVEEIAEGGEQGQGGPDAAKNSQETPSSDKPAG